MKRLVLLLCLMLLLVSCGTDKKENIVVDDVQTPPVQTEQPEESEKGEDTVANEPARTPEQELIDKQLITVLKEQLAGAYEVKGATFTFKAVEELEGKECFSYEMKNDETTELFAIATDSSRIYHLEGMDFVKIFDME